MGRHLSLWGRGGAENEWDLEMTLRRLGNTEKQIHSKWTSNPSKPILSKKCSLD